MQFQGLAQIRERLFFSLALTRHIYLKALGNKPVALSPYRRRERSLHKTILPQADPAEICHPLYINERGFNVTWIP